MTGGYLLLHRPILVFSFCFLFFFFQAEDGIRDKLVTGVQTCALPIYNFVWQYIDIYTPPELFVGVWLPSRVDPGATFGFDVSYANASRRSATSVIVDEIGRASCRERV